MRIASLSPAVTEILFALGVHEQIVCRDQFSLYPEDAKAIPGLKGHQDIDLDALREHKPELVFTSTVIQEKLAAKLSVCDEWSAMHIDVSMLLSVYESIRTLGTLFALEDIATQIIAQMQQGFGAVKKKAALLPRKPRVYIEEWHDPPMASGNWVPELIKIAGGEPFPIRAGELSREVTLAEVAAFNPDLIIISWCGAGVHADKTILTDRPGWNELTAIKEGNVRVVDDSLLNRPGPRLVEGAQYMYGWLFEMLH